MSWVAKAQAAAKIAAEKGAQLAKELNDELHAQSATNDKIAIGLDVVGALKDAAKSGQSKLTESVAKASETDSGKNFGEKARTAMGFLSKIPVLSMISDSLKARNGVQSLYEDFVKHPEDPQAAIWLAEALARTQVDMRVISTLKSIVQPTYFLVWQSVKAVTSLGLTPEDRTELFLLKRAFYLAKSEIGQNPNDARAMHVLARVYMAMNEMTYARISCEMSIAARDTSPLPWISLSKIHLALGDLNAASDAADQAVALGNSLGHEMKANVMLVEVGQDGSVETLKDYCELVDKVTIEDRAAYFGCAIDGVSIFSDVKNGQLDKWNKLKEKAMS